MDQALEIVRLRVSPASAASFVDRRAEADAALQRFAGFLGSELAEGPPGSWTLIVRWASRGAMEAAQAVTLATPGLPALADWLALTDEVVSFEAVDVRRPAGIGEPHANLAIARRFVEHGIAKADASVFDECVDRDVVVTTGLSPAEPIRGRDAYKAVFAGFADAWPVRRFEVTDAFAVADRVVVRFTATTVFTKDYYGVPADGLVAPLDEVHVYTLRAGRIVAAVVGAINLPFEFTMYPALRDAVLGGLERDRGAVP